MNSYADWLAGNERYIRLLVESLIARLEQYVESLEEPQDVPVVATEPLPEANRRTFGIFSRRAAPPSGAESAAQLRIARDPRGTAAQQKQAAADRTQAGADQRRAAAERMQAAADTMHAGSPTRSGADPTRCGAGPTPSGADPKQAAADPSQAEADLAALETMQPPPALRILQQRFNLTDFERETLLLCAALEFDARVSSLCARVSAATGQSAPSFALALSLFEDPSWDAIAPDRPLRYWHLLEIIPSPAQPALTSALRADERVVGYLRGLAQLDARIAPALAPMRAATSTLPASQDEVARRGLNFVLSALRAGRSAVIQLAGPDSQSKLDVAAQIGRAASLTLFHLSAESIPAHASDLEIFVRLWERECALMPVALYLNAASVERSTALSMFLSRLAARSAVVFVDTSTQSNSITHDALTLEVRKPSPQEQRQYWADVLAPEQATIADSLAAQFNFNLTTIRDVANEVAALEPDGDAVVSDGAGEGPPPLWAACLRRARPALDQLAQPIETKATWDDLEVPATERALLRQIVDQTRSRLVVYDEWGFRERTLRGLGISALFAGDSGTGKTMAAEVIANELSLLLYRIDLSAVVSKYIGDTERNLKRLFDAAEDGGAILFFDEADALFGKRSEVKDSHDRYANIEVNYLLQRMEAYRGLAILATNQRAALDSAFTRRLRFIVNFPFPGVAERAAMWSKAFPARTPRGALDIARLARLNLSGGSIHSIALNAAFMAAQAGTPVTMSLVLEAARAEMRKLDKPVIESDFRRLDAAGAHA